MSAKILIIASAALAASAAATVPAAADPAPGRAHGLTGGAVMFNLIDRNGDGAIDEDEAGAVTAAVFAALDANSDGTLTKDELGTALRRMHMGGGSDFRRGAHRDDGARWHMGRGDRFYRGDGPRRQMMGRWGDEDDTARGGPGPMMGQGQGQGQGVGQGPGLGEGPLRLQMHDFATLDTNGDGVISQEEFEAAAPMGPGMGPGTGLGTGAGPAK